MRCPYKSRDFVEGDDGYSYEEWICDDQGCCGAEYFGPNECGYKDQTNYLCPLCASEGRINYLYKRPDGELVCECFREGTIADMQSYKDGGMNALEEIMAELELDKPAGMDTYEALLKYVTDYLEQKQLLNNWSNNNIVTA